MRAAWLLVAVPVLSGCGGSPHTTTTTASDRLTHQQFVAKGNLVCLHSDRRIYRLGALSRDPAKWTQAAAAAELATAQMAKLRPPLADRAGFARLLELARRLTRGIDGVHAALMRHDYATARATQARAAGIDAAIHAAARSVGLTFCQQALTNWPA